MQLFSFKKGIHPNYNKQYAHKKEITTLEAPKQVVIPLQQHIGAQCKSLVKKGDEVKIGQKIGEAEAFVTSPVHSSVSGKVKVVEPRLHPNGVKILSIVIDSDGKDEICDTIGKVQDFSSLTPQEISAIIKNAGIVGLGGAAFPTHIKLNPPKDKTIEYVILNGAECEPYLTSDHRVMLEYPSQVLYGMKALMKSVGVTKGFIGIEVNKKDAIKVMQQVLVKDKDNQFDIAVTPLAVKYPQGAEKMLIYAVLNRKVPAGGLPMDVGVVVQNVSTAVAVSNAIKFSRPLMERVVTITGSGIKEPKNLIIRFGTSVREVFEKCGGLTSDAKKVIMGGPMMGASQASLDIPVIKGTSGILVLNEEDVTVDKSGPCIGCGMCVEACPMVILPTTIAAFAEHKKDDEAESTGILDCIECGCCTFVCPSKRQLVQNIRLGKARIMAKKRGTKK